LLGDVAVSWNPTVFDLSRSLIGVFSDVPQTTARLEGFSSQVRALSESLFEMGFLKAFGFLFAFFVAVAMTGVVARGDPTSWVSSFNNSFDIMEGRKKR
jgi:hypothetical protein